MKLVKKNPNESPNYKSRKIKMSSSDNWRTPDWLFDKVNKEFSLFVDLAADHQNHKLSQYYTKENSALKTTWYGRGWANIPYSSPAEWFYKARESAFLWKAVTVLLVKADTSTKYWAETVKDAHVRFLAGRVKFWDENNQPHHSANFPSALVIFSPETIGNGKFELWDYRGEKAVKIV